MDDPETDPSSMIGDAAPDAPGLVDDWPTGYPGASPASFWDRSTWDPNTLGAITFGQPTAPWRPPAQVQADAMDALFTGPAHPGWAEPITRMAIDRNLACINPYPLVGGPLSDGLHDLAAQPDADPGLKAWAAKDTLIRAGMHPLEAQWAMNAAAAQAAPQTRVLGAPVQPSASGADADDDDDDDDGEGDTEQDAAPTPDPDIGDDDGADDPEQGVAPSQAAPGDGQAPGSPPANGPPAQPPRPGITLTQHGGQPASGDDPSPIDEVVVTGKRPTGSPGQASASQPYGSFGLSVNGANMIKSHEQALGGGFAAKPYPSLEGGAPSIGWGHKIQPGEVFDKPLTREQADALFSKDVAGAERRVKGATKGVNLNQGQYDALVSFAYNSPSAFVAKSDNHFLQRLQSGDLAGAADRMPLWNKAGPPGAKRALPGLTRRRQEERNLFLNGVYPSSQ